jgi:hypothetical protein
MFGEFTDELLNKCHRHGITIPPEYGKMKEEVKKRIEQPACNGTPPPPMPPLRSNFELILIADDPWVLFDSHTYPASRSSAQIE